MRHILLSLSALLFTVLLTSGIYCWSYVSTPASGTSSVVVTVPAGMGVRGIGILLADQGVLTAGDIRFALLAKVTGLSGKLRAGEYLFPSNLTPLDVLHVLVEGDVVQHAVTVPEGATIMQIAKIFAQDGWVEAEKFIRLAENPDVARSLGVDQEGLEGYLFPDTYYLTRGTVDELQVLRLMTSRFFTILEGLPKEKLEGFDLHQMVTLASMVEKETGVASERPLIAGVFFNRLKRKMRLQSDPTVIYGIKDFDGNLTRKDLRTPSPYNTYVISGLPIGPICNPGKEALSAVLDPETTEAIYFVSRNDGTHVFSKTLKQHNAAVRKYQKNYKARK